MKTLQFQEVYKDPDKDSDWTDSTYQGQTAVGLMERQARDLKLEPRPSSNLRYRWKIHLSTGKAENNS